MVTKETKNFKTVAVLRERESEPEFKPIWVW